MGKDFWAFWHFGLPHNLPLHWQPRKNLVICQLGNISLPIQSEELKDIKNSKGLHFFVKFNKVSTSPSLRLQEKNLLLKFRKCIGRSRSPLVEAGISPIQTLGVNPFLSRFIILLEWLQEEASHIDSEKNQSQRSNFNAIDLH